MIDFRVERKDRDENKAILIEYKKNDEIQVRKLYIRELTPSLALRLSEIYEKREDLLNNEVKITDIKKLKMIYEFFHEFLKLTISNYDEIIDLLNDLPADANFMEKFQSKIIEKMNSSESEEKTIKKKTKKSYMKK